MTATAELVSTPAPAPSGAGAPRRAVHTANFSAILRRLGASLLVTTYQAGKLVMVRDEGDHLNTHFRTFPAPMGLALHGDRLAIGTSMQIWEYRDVPAVTAKLGAGLPRDACFLPRRCHVTGNVQGHEMAWGGDDLWFVNTRFSCLCTLDPSCSAAVPGFTRGLDFAGNLAFVGLSQVRESAVFSGIPITDRLSQSERTCGVCAVDMASGNVVALLRFEDAVQEVFAVQVLPGKRYPELINDDSKLLENSFVLPDEALRDVPDPLRARPGLG